MSDGGYRIAFYACGSCGAMSAQNFRDGFCKVCHVATKVEQIILDCDRIEIRPAPHLDEPEGLRELFSYIKGSTP